MQYVRVCHFKQDEGRDQGDGSECEGVCCLAEFDPQDPQGRRRQLTPTSCPPTPVICCGVL